MGNNMQNGSRSKLLTIMKSSAEALVVEHSAVDMTDSVFTQKFALNVAISSSSYTHP